MATNGNIDYGNNGNNIPTKGVSSNIANRQAKREFSNQFWEPDIGYLAKATEELKNQNKAMLEILNTDTKLKKSQKDRLDLNLKENDKIIAKLNKMRDTQEASFKDILDTMDEASTAVNNSLKAQNKLLDRNSKTYEEQLEYITKTKEEIDKMNLSAKETAQTIKKTQGSFAKGMSETLGTISSEFRELSNMFNLNDIANGKINTYVKSKLDTQNDIMKQFGMQSVNQYISLKNNMDSTLNSMNKDFNNMFNQTDLKNYMANLSNLGITDSVTAQEQMRSSMLATKYLGTSNETQQEIFKYMKRTNDYTMLDNHNKTIVGILKAQLGVSSEQLDMMNQQALNNVDALAGLGLSTEAQGNFVNSYTKSQAALTSLYGQDVSDSIMNVVSEFANSDYSNLSNLTKKYGTGASGAYSSFINTGDTEALIKYLMSNSGFANISGDAGVNATLQSQLGQDRGFNAAILSTNLNDFTDKLGDIDKAIKNGGSVDDFISDTTQITAVDKISNMLDSFINGLDWASYIDLSTAAFAFWGAAKVFDIINFFSQAKTLGFLKEGVASLAGKAGSGKAMSLLTTAGKGILGVGGGIAIGAASIAALAKATSDAVITAKDVTPDLANFEKNALSSKYGADNALVTDSAYSNVHAQAKLSENRHNWLSVAGGATANYFTGWINKLSKPEKKNKETWLNFMKVAAGLNDADSQEALYYMYSILMNEVGMPSIASDLFGINKDNIKTYIKNYPDASSKLNWAWSYFKNNIGHGVYMPENSYGEPYHGNFSLQGYGGMGGLGDIGIGGGGRDMSFKPFGITAGYPNYPSGKRHRGVDFGFPMNTPIGATVSGIVSYVKDSGKKGYGKHVLVHGNDGRYYLYGHMSNPAVTSGQQVVSGQLLGYSGNTGNSTGPHLHYEVRNSASYGSDIDPYPYINSSLWNIGEMSPTAMMASSSANTEGAPVNSMPIATRRALPSDFTNTTGVGGTEAIVDSNDSNMNRLIRFLSGIKGEQDINREILMAYSRANASSNISI